MTLLLENKTKLLLTVGAMMTLGCVQGLAAPTAAVEAQTSTVTPDVGEGGAHVERGPGFMAWRFSLHRPSLGL